MPISNEDFKIYGFSSMMGPLLRHTVEQQLRQDLLHYGVQHTALQFDWSASCLEGTEVTWLDGHIENFSGIVLLNQQKQTAVEGWMDFILADGQLLVYWDNLTTWATSEKHTHKKQFGIPPHIWDRLSERLKHINGKNIMKTTSRIM